MQEIEDMEILINCLPGAIVVLLMGIHVGVFILNRKLKNRNRRRPLGFKLLRFPGESLQLKIDDINTDLHFYLLAPSLYVMLAFSSISLNKFYKGEIGWKPGEILVYSLTAAIIIVFSLFKTIKLYNKRKCLNLGLEAERAVGEELDRLRRFGCFVFHDFPAERFNIDHILVSKSGVFAIETKGRMKKTDLKKNWRVQYFNNRLIFPDREEIEPVKQAKRQAKWLSSFLSRKIGRDIPVKAVLAIPGWFVDIRQKPQNLILTNGRNLEFLVKDKEVLTNNDVALISNIIEERCRNVSMFNEG